MPTLHENQQGEDTRTVLVFGATGRQGGAVATALKAGGWHVRALVRKLDSDAAKALASGGMQIMAGDLSDLASIRAAMTGSYGVFSMQPNSGSEGSDVTDADEIRFGKAVVDIAVESGVQHLVYSSAGIISRGLTGLANLDSKIAIEEYVRGSGMTHTIVRPATFMDLLVNPGMGLNRGTFSFFLHPDQSAQFVAVEDIGNVVAAVFADRARFASRIVDIAGDEVNGLDLEVALSQASGRPIAYRRFSAAMLDSDPALRRNAKVFDEGRGTGNANIAELDQEFGHLQRVHEWLAGSGSSMLRAAMV